MVNGTTSSKALNKNKFKLNLQFEDLYNTKNSVLYSLE